MEGKLFKMVEGYTLSLTGSIDDLYGISNKQLAEDHQLHKLSIKNCDAISNGYDLIKLIEENSKYSEEDWGDGFLFAMNLMSDKKFSEKELTMLFAYGHQIGMNDVLAIQSQHSPQPMPKPDSDKLRDELIQSLQQNEWDVEIEMEKCGYCEGCNKAGMLHCAHADSCGFPIETERPKLDENGCLILKRK